MTDGDAPVPLFAPLPLASRRCTVCGARTGQEGSIYTVLTDGDVLAFCSPAHAAEGNLRPWCNARCNAR